jgi:hypothetical protein
VRAGYGGRRAVGEARPRGPALQFREGNEVAGAVNPASLPVSQTSMKTGVLMTLSLVAAPLVFASQVAPGVSLADVRGELGRPSGVMQVGERHLLYYPHGLVELVNNQVTRVELRTPEEQASLEEREARRRAERDERRMAVIAEGTALRDRKLADATFAAAPAGYQVAFWEDFARRYPEVSCVEPLTIARLKLGEEIEKKTREREDEQRLADLEARLAAAEAEPFYRVRYHGGYRGYYNEFALWPVKYTYYDAPLPVYTTPTTPVINAFPDDPRPADWRAPGREWSDNGKDNRRIDYRDRRYDWRGADRRDYRRRERY